ncbi:hypothetical protein ACLOJK_005604 [Asimina triloba]
MEGGGAFTTGVGVEVGKGEHFWFLEAVAVRLEKCTNLEKAAFLWNAHMDYDDGNNFQSQKFQLAGEDNKKFPPGLQFALPRFDLDEHIQVDLRFDGLAEAQVLPGIESCEDNHWIEDFSQGSSGIEFSSGAAESLSISMRNNVWSEATSSESVEMLLKSVGEDDIVAEQTIREESEGSDVLDGLNNQMDHNSSHDDLFPAKMEDIIYTDPTVPPDKAVKNPSVSCEGTTADLTLFESIRQTHRDEKSAYENLIDLDGSPIRGDPYANISSTEEYNLDTNASMANSKQLGHAPAACGVAATSENTSLEGMEPDPLATSVGNPVGDAGGNENQKLPNQATNGCGKVVSCEEPENFLLNDVKQGEVQILSEHTSADAQDSGAKPVGSCTSDVSPSCLILDADSSLMVTEECNKMMLYEEADPLKANAQQGIEVLGKDNETSDHGVRNTQDLSNLGIGEDKNFKVELGDISNIDAGNCTSSLAKVSPSVDMANEEKKTVKLGALKHNLGDSAVEASSQDVNFKVTGKKAADKVAESSSNNTSVSSYVSGSAIPEKVHCTHDLIDVNNADLHRSPSLLTKSSRLLGVLSGGSQIVSGDSIVERESRRLSSDSHGVDVESDASANGKCANMAINKAHRPPSEQEVDHEPVSSEDAAGECTELTCSNQLGTVNTVDIAVAELKGDEKLSSPVSNFTHLDNREARTEISTKQSASSLDDSASPGGQSPHCAAIISNRSEDLQSDAVLQSHSALDKSVDTAGESESQESIAIAAAVGSNPDLGGQHGSHTPVGNGSKKSEALKSHEDLFKKRYQNQTGVTDAMSQAIGRVIRPMRRLSILGSLGGSCGEAEVEELVVPPFQAMRNELGKRQYGKERWVGWNSKSAMLLWALQRWSGLCNEVYGDMPGCLKESLPQPVSSTEKPVFRDVESGSGIADTAVANCGSPTVISCSEHLQGERVPQESGNKNSAPKTDTVCCDQTDNLAQVDKSTVHDPKGKGVSEDDRSFTFEVVSLPESAERETGKGWKLFNNMQPFKVPQKPGEMPSTTSVLHQTNPEHLPKSLPGSLRASDVQKTHGTKSHGKDKIRSAASGTSERGSSKQRKAAKETSGLKQTIEKDNKLGGASPILIGNVSGNTAGEGMRQFAHSEGGGAKISATQTIQTPGLPDLNSSASSATIYHQPFTDLQQVQLRAQIFVYGSLIQGTAPDEACMISAFGDASRDGGRGMWENVWCAAVERVKNQRSPLSNLDTPIHSRSGIRDPEQVPRATPHHMKAHGSPASRTNSKGSLLAVASPVMSLSSPSWSLSPSRDGLQSGTMPRGPFLDSHQSPMPLHPYRSSHPQHHVGNSTSWFSQASSPAAWFLSQTTALEPAAKHSALPVVEAVQVTSVRDLTTTTQHASNTQLAPNSLAATEIPATVPGGTAIEAKKATSSDQKSRKRKKNSVSEELDGQINSTQSQQAASTDVVKQLATSVGISSPLTQCRVVDGSIVSNSSPVLSLMQNQALSSSDLDPQVATSEEMCRKIEQAKLQAEDAAAVAASAVRHSQEIWSRLSLQKSSGLVSEVEAKVASAAVAAAAAASVAKAAAAAAKVASEAAFQAKLMADEAVNSQGSETGFLDSGAKLGVMTPALILKGKNKASSSSSVIVAAREVARKRVEAAAAATKRAENLDAVVKAAELAAEAVSQAGVIVAMGDPIPLLLSELIEAGPEGNWKVQQVSSQQIIDANGGHGEQSKIDPVNDQPSHTREAKGSLNEASSTPFLKEHSRQPIENIPVLKEPLKDSTGNEKGPGVRKGRKTSELTKTIVVTPEAEAAMGAASVPVQIDSNPRHEQVGADKEDIIKEGSHVEVASDMVGLRGFWFSAKVLSLKDGHAHVCYSELLQDEGLKIPKKVVFVPKQAESKVKEALIRAQLKECIPLKGDGDKTPKIRIAHPMTAAKFEGTRKRRRAVAGNYVWSVGDQATVLVYAGIFVTLTLTRMEAFHVTFTLILSNRPLSSEHVARRSGSSDDERVHCLLNSFTTNFQMIQEFIALSGSSFIVLGSCCWREGVVMEKGKEDETKLTIRFPAEGDLSIVRAWNLRPSLVWKDGQWIERSRENIVQHYEQHDTPKGKRSKVTEHEVEIDSQVDASGQENLSKSLSEDSRKVEDSRPLMLSAKDTVFSLGKSTSDLNNSDAIKFKRTGLQKEGSKVVFGVPKPGKKRKFMEVSKNLVLDQTSKTNEGMDPTKVAKYLIPQGYRGWKNASKVDFKGKQIADSKPKVVKSGKAQSVQNKTKSEKNGSSVPLSSAASEDTGPDLLMSAKVSSISHEVDNSFSNGLKEADNSVIISSLDPVSDLPSSRNKPSPANVVERGFEGKLLPAAENMLRNDDRGPNLSEHPGIEPRRSNRRIQPTSRVKDVLGQGIKVLDVNYINPKLLIKLTIFLKTGNIRLRENQITKLSTRAKAFQEIGTPQIQENSVDHPQAGKYVSLESDESQCRRWDPFASEIETELLDWECLDMTKEALRVLVTGAAGQIGYALVPMVARGIMLGPDQPVILHMLDIPPAAEALNGVKMELVDAAFPLLKGVVATTDAVEACMGVNIAVMVGGFPRKEGMERKDVMSKNVSIYKDQAAALEKHAAKNCKLLVVANPANTNALILKEFAPSIPEKNITCLTRLDHNRALGQISERLNVEVSNVKNVIIWGNHSSTQYPDVNHATVTTASGVKNVKELVADDQWLKGEFITTVQQRGAAIIKARKLSSALSAAGAACDHIRDWVLGTPKDTWVSMGVYSDGSYGIPPGLIYSFPVTCEKGEWSIVQGLKIDEFSRAKMDATANELIEEKSLAYSCLN